MTKRSKSSAGAPIESGATPDVASPTPDPPDRPAPDTARTAAAPAPPAKNGQERGSAQEVHDQHRGEPSHPGIPLSPPGIVPESDVRVHTPAAAAPQPEHGHVNEGLGELPWAYGDARLVGLVRDPTTLFVYWDFSPQQIEQAFMGLGPARSVLKLWNARNGSGELVRETEVHLDARGWYVRDLPAGIELRPELWAVGERGARLMRAARPIRLPPAIPSDQLEAFYLRLALDQPIASGISAGRALNYGGAAPAGWERRLQPRPFSGSSVGGPFGSSPGGKLPWSATHMIPDLDGDDQ
ncbi:MAG: DUF4912 domain-containing protein [Deltaproteobacteria bacterium]|nr:MAG: DUF4912 domain-containing protein [Deltaproteobacteria bacterium]TMA76366.1 MAG: DUF4912 domain-containing protein [Deltaproteobacteria bacterium]TMB39357.1 MAG: DUF4912 domain-containing protein [Deltaproteobacteria bacterium]